MVAMVASKSGLEFVAAVVFPRGGDVWGQWGLL